MNQEPKIYLARAGGSGEDEDRALENSAAIPADSFSYTTVRDHAFTVTEGSVSNVRRLEPGKNVKWEITVAPDSDADVTIAVNATTDCSAEGAICTSDGGKLSGGLELVVPGPQENSAATGAPTINGTAQVGETLSASTSGISDADGVANATFTYQWLADDTEISGATPASRPPIRCSGHPRSPNPRPASPPIQPVLALKLHCSFLSRSAADRRSANRLQMLPSRGSWVRIPSPPPTSPPHGEEAPSHRAEIADLVALRGASSRAVIRPRSKADTRIEGAKTLDNADRPLKVQTDNEGRVWLIMGIDSGFEGLTVLYYDRISYALRLVEAPSMGGS